MLCYRLDGVATLDLHQTCRLLHEDLTDRRLALLLAGRVAALARWKTRVDRGPAIPDMVVIRCLGGLAHRAPPSFAATSARTSLRRTAMERAGALSASRKAGWRWRRQASIVVLARR